MNPEKKDDKASGKPRHAIANHYLCIVSKNNWNAKKDNGACYVATVVGKKELLGMK